MPSFRSLGDTQVRAIVGYLRSLQGRLETGTLPGDAKRGKEIFFGKGTCSTCHTMSGEGGFLGPDLSSYGYGASADALRNEITRPRKTAPHGYQAAVLTTQGGERLDGMIRNEDNFSLQFQTKDGVFHFVQKSDVRALDRLDASLMPSDFGERLSVSELNDLVSYLISAAVDAGDAERRHKKKDDFE